MSIFKRTKQKSSAKPKLAWGHDSLPLSVDQNVPIDPRPRRYGKRKFSWSKFFLVIGCLGAVGGFLFNDNIILTGNLGVVTSQSVSNSLPTTLYYNNSPLQQVAVNPQTIPPVMVWKGAITVAANLGSGGLDTFVGSIKINSNSYITSCAWQLGASSEICLIYKNNNLLKRVIDQKQGDCWVRSTAKGQELTKACATSGVLFPLVLPSGVVGLNHSNL